MDVRLVFLCYNVLFFVVKTAVELSKQQRSDGTSFISRNAISKAKKGDLTLRAHILE